jgi:hypothetical protein
VERAIGYKGNLSAPRLERNTCSMQAFYVVGAS